jgi:hypothetical protein
MTRSPLRLLTVVSLVLVVAGFASGVLADAKPVLRLHAYSVDLNTPRARTNGLEIAIERWSTPEEAARLRAILAEKGPDALLDALRSMKPRAGYIRPDTGIGWDIGFAQQVVAADGSRRIIFGTDRPISFWEAVNRPRSADYQFTLGEARLKADGTGEGKLVPAAKITFNSETNTLQIENYQIEPVRLVDVRVEK